VLNLAEMVEGTGTIIIADKVDVVRVSKGKNQIYRLVTMQVVDIFIFQSTDYNI